MRTPRFGVPPRQNFIGGLEEDEDRVRDELLQSFAVETGENRREIVRADIDDDRDTVGVFVLRDFAKKRLDQRDRQVVRTIKAEILERRLDV